MRTLMLSIVTAAVLAAAAPAGGAEAGAAADGPIASPEAGWPQWRGPRRDGISDETGLLQTWPEGGPKPLWSASGLGHGWSSPIIVGGTIYITGDVGDELRIFALDMEGKPKWQATNGRSWRGSHPGARASCAYSKGRLYHMNAHGRVACLDAATGREVWAVDVLERFRGRQLTWALSECLLVDGPRVIVTPGGEKAFMAALDATTGETVWASEPLDDPRTQRTGYASPILVRWGGRRLLVNLALRALVCVDADSGRRHWVYPMRTKHDASCATPTYWQGGIFYTLPSESGCVFLKLTADGERVGCRKAWEGRMDNISGGAVAWKGFLYGSGQHNTGWVCMDAATGEVRYNSKTLKQGAVLYADDRLYCLGEGGTMLLVKVGPEGFDAAGRFRLVENEKCTDAWAHPVILDGRLYLRYHDKLTRYDVRRPK